jgi:hypothetical protein
MARTLTARMSELTYLLRLVDMIPGSKIQNAGKLSSVRRAIKKATEEYNVNGHKILEPINEEYEKQNKKLQDQKTKKAKEPIEKEMQRLATFANEKMKEYGDKHNIPTTVTFDNEAFSYTRNLFEETAKDIFGQYHKDKDGNIKEESYDNEAADELFALLDKTK